MKELIRLKKNQKGIETFISLVNEGLEVVEIKDSTIIQSFEDGTKELENGLYIMNGKTKVAKLSEKLSEFLINKNVIEL